MVCMQLLWFKRSKNVMQSFPFMPRCYNIIVIVFTSLMSPYYILMGSGPRYVSSERDVQNPPTSAKIMKIALLPWGFLLRSFYIVQVRTSLDRFLWHLSKTMPLWVQYRILKIMYRILCKTEGSRPYWTDFSTTNKCFDSTQITKAYKNKQKQGIHDCNTLYFHWKYL